MDFVLKSLIKKHWSGNKQGLKNILIVVDKVKIELAMESFDSLWTKIKDERMDVEEGVKVGVEIKIEAKEVIDCYYSFLKELKVEDNIKNFKRFRRAVADIIYPSGSYHNDYKKEIKILVDILDKIQKTM